VLHCAVFCSFLQCVAACFVCCSVLQCVAVCCSVLQCEEAPCQIGANRTYYDYPFNSGLCCSVFVMCCSVLQCVALCIVLQCVAACFRVLQCEEAPGQIGADGSYSDEAFNSDLCCSVFVVCCDVLQCVALCCSVRKPPIKMVRLVRVVIML